MPPAGGPGSQVQTPVYGMSPVKRSSRKVGNIELLNVSAVRLAVRRKDTGGSATHVDRELLGEPDGRGTVAFYPYRKFRPEDPEGQVSPSSVRGAWLSGGR